ncbi:hypothetical protein [Bradyrhizobium sp. ARR65]|uniref:hypothetical protein n=1 Tax=Bradyrhizobium sp. ARR65 TaxID=1040989 RepID=UPI000B30470C|nr:hypothetical protein [Bradyrhizobium sp. ARR65]
MAKPIILCSGTSIAAIYAIPSSFLDEAESGKDVHDQVRRDLVAGNEGQMSATMREDSSTSEKATPQGLVASIHPIVVV